MQIKEEIILQDMGFTHAESKVYLLLLELGSVKVGRLIEKSGLQSSTVHNTLNSLSNKGHVSYVLKGKIKIYQAVAPKNIMQEFRDKEMKFESILPRLEQKFRFSGERPEAEIFEGTSGVMTLLKELIEDAKPKDNYYFFAVREAGFNEEIQKFFEAYDIKRKDKGLIVRGIAESDLRQLFAKRKFLKMRYVDHPIPSNISICRNKIALITWGKKPTGILIKSEQQCKSQIKFFNTLWDSASP